MTDLRDRLEQAKIAILKRELARANAFHEKLANKLIKANAQLAELERENTRLRLRVERLRGLCKSAVGMLNDDHPKEAEQIYEQIGDMEKDAERYRFLKNNAFDVDCYSDQKGLDAGIDEAIRAKESRDSHE